MPISVSAMVASFCLFIAFILALWLNLFLQYPPLNVDRYSVTGDEDDLLQGRRAILKQVV